MNGLPQCQLVRLQALVDGVQSKWAGLSSVSLASQDHCAFWMDTLCIPVGKEYYRSRELAILSLTRVFSDANTVLVLDTELSDVSIKASSLERELRVITSDWMRRVWTLQEALLTRPGNLYWQSKEQALAAEDIWQENKEHNPLVVSYRMSAFDRRLPVLAIEPGDPDKLSNDFLDIIYALRYRSLSRVEDETICIAPIIGLDRKELLVSKVYTTRIKTFLSMWKKKGPVGFQYLLLEGNRNPWHSGHQTSSPLSGLRVYLSNIRGSSFAIPLNFHTCVAMSDSSAA